MKLLTAKLDNLIKSKKDGIYFKIGEDGKICLGPKTKNYYC